MSEQLDLFDSIAEEPTVPSRYSKSNPKFQVSAEEHQRDRSAFLADARHFIEDFIESTMETAFSNEHIPWHERAYAIAWLLEDMVPCNSSAQIEPTSFQGLSIALGADPWSLRASIEQKWNRLKHKWLPNDN